MSEVRTFRLAGGAGGRFLKVCGIVLLLTCILVPLAIISLPLAIACFVLRKRAYVATDDEGLTMHWWGTRSFRWSEVERITHGRLQRGARRLGAGTILKIITRKLGRPMVFQLRGEQEPQQIPLLWFEAPDALLQTVRERTGLALPGEEPGDEAA